MVLPPGCCRSSGGWLTIELYSTRELPITDALPSNKMDVVRSDAVVQHSAALQRKYSWAGMQAGTPSNQGLPSQQCGFTCVRAAHGLLSRACLP